MKTLVLIAGIAVSLSMTASAQEIWHDKTFGCISEDATGLHFEQSRGANQIFDWNNVAKSFQLTLGPCSDTDEFCSSQFAKVTLTISGRPIRQFTGAGGMYSHPLWGQLLLNEETPRMVWTQIQSVQGEEQNDVTKFAVFALTASCFEMN